MKLERWETALSDKRDLTFQELRDTGDGYVVVRSGDGCRFEIELGDWCGPYVVIGEEYLTMYWNNMPKNTGWTFKVYGENSGLMRCYNDASESEGYLHYVVSTQDSCIEILARQEPKIRAVQDVQLDVPNSADQSFEIIDGVRRSKAAELAGNKKINAEIVDANDNVIGRIEVPLESLRSPKTNIDLSSSQANTDRFMNTLDKTRSGSTPPDILVTPGNRGTRIEDVGFDQP